MVFSERALTGELIDTGKANLGSSFVLLDCGICFFDKAAQYFYFFFLLQPPKDRIWSTLLFALSAHGLVFNDCAVLLVQK